MPRPSRTCWGRTTRNASWELDGYSNYTNGSLSNAASGKTELHQPHRSTATPRARLLRQDLLHLAPRPAPAAEYRHSHRLEHDRHGYQYDPAVLDGFRLAATDTGNTAFTTTSRRDDHDHRDHHDGRFRNKVSSERPVSCSYRIGNPAGNGGCRNYKLDRDATRGLDDCGDTFDGTTVSLMTGRPWQDSIRPPARRLTAARRRRPARPGPGPTTAARR